MNRKAKKHIKKVSKNNLKKIKGGTKLIKPGQAHFGTAGF